MVFRGLTAASIATAVAFTPVGEARADAGDFIGGMVVGGVLGHVITKDQQQKKQRQRTVTRTYRSGIPATERGVQTQSALNYFGYNAGRVDGQVGPGTRRAIEAYQVTMGYPVNGRNFAPYQYDFLMQAYYWAQNGGQAQTRLVGQPLLLAYRQQVQTGTLYAGTPGAVLPPQTTVVVAPPTTVVTTTAPAAVPEPEAPTEAPTEVAAEPALPNLFAGGGAAAMSLANKCNGVMLQTSSNGGYTTLASMTDANFTLSEQFCLARSYAIARGEELMGQIQGLTPQQVGEQCSAFGSMMQAQVDAISVSPQPEAEAGMRSFALNSGIPPADLAATARVCLAVGYSRDDMPVALGSALMLVTMGEAPYGELLGHHLREGVGTTQRMDLALQWYDASLGALESGASAVFMPGQVERPSILREATLRLTPGTQQGQFVIPNQGAAPSALPTFKVSQ